MKMKSENMNEMVICPVCGKGKVDEGDMTECPVCGWHGDSVQRRHPDWTGENNITLNEAKDRYAKYGTMNRKKIIAMGGTI